MGYAVLVTFFSAMIGTGIGMVSGWIGGWADEAITKASDVLRAFPSIVLVLIIVSVLEIGIQSVCLAMLITRWIWYARVARNLTRTELTRTSIMAVWPAAGGQNCCSAISCPLFCRRCWRCSQSILAVRCWPSPVTRSSAWAFWRRCRSGAR